MNTTRDSAWFSDLIIVLRGIWILLIFDLAAFFLFVKTTQGADVILCMIEDLGNAPVQPLTFIFLQAAMLFWAISSELTCRWMVYLTDNSGKSLSRDRVEQRKSIQRRVANVSLFYPFIVFGIAMLTVVFSGNVKLNNGEYRAVAGILFTSLVLVAGLYVLYISSILSSWSEKRPFSWFVPTGNELVWSKKLYGIYSDVRINISEKVVRDEQLPDRELPTGVVLPDGTTLPAPLIEDDAIVHHTTFTLLKTDFDKDSKLKIWLYRIPRRFYPHLLNQLYLSTGIAALIIIIFLWLPENCFMHLGTAGITATAFACWQIVVVFFNYLNSIRRRWALPIPLGWVLLALFLISSFYNNDHPARKLYKVRKGERQTIERHFGAWLQHLKDDSSGTYRLEDGKTIPVIFVAAEGGALRTGAFTALTLAQLQEDMPFLTKHIYCYSTVSGGSVGANVFNSMVISKRMSGEAGSLVPAIRNFFEHDHLSAVIGKMFFGEVVNYFWPHHIEQFDRAIALERSWEYSGGDTSKVWKPRVNLLDSSFDSTIGGDLPALFINTTEVETGRQCIWSNVDVSALPFGSHRDLYNVTGLNLQYSTAINLSSRFPLVSPGAALCYRDGKSSCRQSHYVDGGYYENKGAETLLQVLNVLPLKDSSIKVFVVQFNFGDSTAVEPAAIRKFSELSEIIAGLYNTRVARTALGQYFLKQKVDSLRARAEFRPVFFNLSSGQCPNNWVLSQAAVREVVGQLPGVIEKQLNFSGWRILNGDTLIEQISRRPSQK
ncbi:hypothetical protein [Chitinophaga filiformis]|uniref:Patatin-like phospholipase n=1 Tax=Chitinophaga filiformis TaxID=104663 RepID=A0ABY4HYE2_CHIFI|nr:hypothetical protein [Chitinophaga filiformis]UPK68415.1 hypothetical protein MYF79_26015 [Chitinophaga filiformis]